MTNVKTILSVWNRYRKEKFPSNFISRKKYNLLRDKYDLLTASIASPENPLLQQAEIQCVVPFGQKNQHSEVCFFVSYSPTLQIKPHVKHHIQELLAAGLEVVLIINTDAHDVPLQPAPELMPDLSGLYIRENIGFDFSAWSHVYSLAKDQMQARRVYLVNDSVIGPLSRDMLVALLQTVRDSSAALIGLTKNEKPRYHLQSYFLVLNAQLLENELFSTYFANLWALPTKEMVIDTYETNLTPAVVRMGFDVAVLFPQVGVGGAGDKTDDVWHHVEPFVDLGFPYIKTSVSKKPDAQRLLCKWLPDLRLS